MLIWHHINLDPQQCTSIHKAMVLFKACRCEVFTDISDDTVRLLEKTHEYVHVVQVTYTDTYIKGMPQHNQEKLDKFVDAIKTSYQFDLANAINSDNTVSNTYICLFETDISSTKSATKYSRQNIICRADKLMNDGIEVSEWGVS